MTKSVFLDSEGRVKPPPKRLLLREFRGLLKPRPPLSRVLSLVNAPRGDGHPVFVLPGLLTTDSRTRRLRKFLTQLGYAVYGWEQGVNIGPTDRALAGIERRFLDIKRRHGRKVTLIGHSLGGVFARDLAKRYPDDVRHLVLLGSPIHLPTASNLGTIFQLLSRFHRTTGNWTLDELNRPPPDTVPVSALHTRSDGIVAWETCLEVEGPQRENIEVQGTHSRLPSNPQALAIIAARLAQPEGEWQVHQAEPIIHAGFRQRTKPRFFT